MFYVANKKPYKIKWVKVSFSLLCVLLLFLLSLFFDWQSNRQQSEFDLFEVTRLEGIPKQSGHRIVLYETAWERIKDKPLLGSGYHNFQFYWLKDKKPPYDYMDTRFVHNDYLQIWMETGIFGLAAIVSIILVFYYLAWQQLRVCHADSMPVIIGLIGGLSAYFAHAMIDFVIYPCFLALLFGAYLGTAVRILTTEKEYKLANALGRYVVSIRCNVNFWRIFSCVIIILGLSQPYIAEMAFKQAEKNLALGKIKAGLPYYELARRFAPYNAYYYFQEATYLRLAIMMQQGDIKQVAQRADQLYSGGAKANPYDVKNILSRAVLHRDYPELLSPPANHETILEWIEHVIFWEPGLIAGQAEYVKTLNLFGKKEKARELLGEYLVINPNSVHLKNLERELAL